MIPDEELRAREAALAIYENVALHGQYIQPAVQQLLAQRPHFTAQERALVYDLCFGTARHDFLLAKRVAACLPKPERLPLRSRLALRLAAYELIVKRRSRYGVTNAWVEIVKEHYPRLASVVNGVLRNISTEPLPNDPHKYDTTEAQIQALGLPAFLIKSMNRALGDTTLVNRAIFGMRTPGPTWLTVFEHAGEAATCEELTVTERLPAAGYPASLAVRLQSHVEHTAVFADGHVQPQNPSSLELVRLATLPGGTLLDIASGHGIKAAGFARGGMSVFAAEVDEIRSKAGAQNTKRLHAEVTHIVADATKPVTRLGDMQFDRVVVDAPCSGSGTLRGNPEILFRFRREHVNALRHVQGMMLRMAAPHVRVGGELWYAVCSLTEEEGEGSIAEFLAEHDAFTAAPITPSLPSVAREHGVYILPEDGRDGFYYARLVRQNGS